MKQFQIPHLEAFHTVQLRLRFFIATIGLHGIQCSCLHGATATRTCVSCITLTGSAMVNWSRRLLIQGMKTVIMVCIHVLGLI